MHPKCVVLVAASGGADVDEAAVQRLRAYLQPLEFAQAFSGEQVGGKRGRATHFIPSLQLPTPSFAMHGS